MPRDRAVSKHPVAGYQFKTLPQLQVSGTVILLYFDICSDSGSSCEAKAINTRQSQLSCGYAVNEMPKSL